MTRHENYEILNLIGYGLAKFDARFVAQFGFDSKAKFYDYMVECQIAETAGTVKNRQDLFDPFFDNGRRGWHQKGDAYIHRKISIDQFFGALDERDFADVVKSCLRDQYGVAVETGKAVSPARKSMFKRLQETGYGAETYFMHHYQKIPAFADGALDDARLLGDGYDFQVSVPGKFYLAEVKGIREASGEFRMTANEYQKAAECGDDYALIIVSNLVDMPRMHSFMHPTRRFDFSERMSVSQQHSYHANFSGKLT